MHRCAPCRHGRNVVSRSPKQGRSRYTRSDLFERWRRLRDVSLGSSTAFAVANSSNDTAYLRVFLFDNTGVANADEIFPLETKQQVVRYLHELFPLMGSRFFGTRVDADGEVLGALDIHPVALLESGGLLSSAPVTNIVSIP